MLVVPAHAKVNLALEVVGRRPDGWHEIATVIAPLDWHDLVGLRIDPTATTAPHRVTLRICGPFAEGVPADDANLAARAAQALLHLAGDPPLSIHLWLCKQVPSAAGLGGGSADAAAVLRAGAALLAQHGHGHRLTPQALHDTAAALGSDVPALFHGGTLLATGLGGTVGALANPKAPTYLAVAMAGPSVTAAAYQSLDDTERHGDGRVQRVAAALSARRAPDPQDLGSALEPGACRAAPGLADALRRLRALTPDTPWHLTGSGGAAFAVAPDARTAARLAALAAQHGFPARACRTLSHIA